MWEGSGAEMRSKRLNNEHFVKLCALLGSILEVKIDQQIDHKYNQMLGHILEGICDGF